MADSVVTLRPNGTLLSGSFAAVGAGSLHAATNDNSDTTYANPSGLGPMKLMLDDPTIPALAVVHSVRLRVRAGGGFAQQGRAWIEDPNGRTIFLGNYGGAGSIQTFTLNAATSTPDGTPWTAAALASLLVGFQNSGGAPVYEVYVDVFYNQAPTVAVSAPAGTITTAEPTVTWTYSDPEGDIQERYQVKVFSAAQYGAAGFDPATSPATWTKDAASSAASLVVDVPLPSDTYRAYVAASDAGSGGRYSAWAYSAFTVAPDPPQTPLVTPTAQPATASVFLTVQGQDNMLTTNQADIETDTSGWLNYNLATLARSTAQAAHGAASLSLTATGAGNMGAQTTTGTGACPVTPGDFYTALASFRSGSGTNRGCQVGIIFWTAAGATISTTFGLAVTHNSTGWVQAVVQSITAPAGAAFASVVVLVNGAASGEVCYVDEISVAPGASVNWTRGGLVNGQRFTIERSIDGGTTWQYVRGAGTGSSSLPSLLNPQRSTITDYEAPFATSVQYRAYTVSTDGTTTARSTALPPSTVTITPDSAWLKDPTDPARNIPVTLEGTQLDTDTTEPQAPHWALNRPDPIITAGVVRLDAIPQLTFFFPNDSTWKAFKSLRESGRVLLLQTCYGDSGDEQWYLRLGQTARTSRLTVDTMRTAQPRRVTIDAQAVEAPA